MVLNICNFILRTEQVPIELDIIAIEDYILLLLYVVYLFFLNIHILCADGDQLSLLSSTCQYQSNLIF